VLAQHHVELTELSDSSQGQLVAVHPAYDEGFDASAAPEVASATRRRAAPGPVDQLQRRPKASRRLG